MAPGTACRRRIYVATVDARLIALDAATGQPCADFGAHGTVDLTRGLRNAPRANAEYAETSPPAILHGMVIVGSSVGDNVRTDAPSGEVRAFDARTGALRWTFDPVVQDPADPAWKTWNGTVAHNTGATNTWSVLAVDSARNLVVLPTTSPSPDYFGGERLGDNRYANSVVALNASTGKVVWYFQTVHHDLWDYDNASPPALVTLDRNGRSTDVVLQATKSGQLFVLDRDSGKPAFPVEERAVPRSDVPGEIASRTQPFNTVIAPRIRHPQREGAMAGRSSSRRTQHSNDLRERARWPAVRCRLRWWRQGVRRWRLGDRLCAARPRGPLTRWRYIDRVAIQSAIVPSTSGPSCLDGSVEYPAQLPVGSARKRWSSPGKSFMVTSLLPPDRNVASSISA